MLLQHIYCYLMVWPLIFRLFKLSAPDPERSSLAPDARFNQRATIPPPLISSIGDATSSR